MPRKPATIYSNYTSTPNDSRHETRDQWTLKQKRRSEDIKNRCNGWKEHPRLFLPSHRENLTSLLIDDKHKAIYCYIAKVASTNWKRLWMILTGMTTVKNPLQIVKHLPHKVHDKMMLIKQPHKVSRLQKKLDSYTKLIVVRHPYERLLSAYRDKFEGRGNKHYKKNYAHYIMTTYRKDSNISEIPLAGDGLTFPEFVTYIINLPRGGFDEHWKSYMDSCFPCAIKYDVIAKYETLAEDSERFLRLINAPSNLHFPKVRTTNTSKILGDYLSRLTLYQRKALYSVYENDFKMFHYDKPFN